MADLMNDPEYMKLQAEADEARRQKALLGGLGAIGDNLANRQSVGNFALGRMNPVDQTVSKTAAGFADAIPDPLEEKKRVYEYMRNKYGIAKEQREEKTAQADDELKLRRKSADSAESNSAKAGYKAMGLAVKPTDTAESLEQQYGSLPKYRQEKFGKDLDRNNKIAEINAKVPKGFIRQLNPESGEYENVAIASAGKTLPAGEGVALGDANASIAALGDISDIVTKNPTMFGPGVGMIDKAAAKLGVGEMGRNASTVNGILKQRAQIIGKYLEGGKLTDSDIARYEASLPQFGDHPDVAQSKIQSLQRLIAQKQAASKGALGDLGYNVGNVRTSAVRDLPQTKKGGTGLIPEATAAEPARAPLAPPKRGDVVDGHIFMGGDPSKPESWVEKR